MYSSSAAPARSRAPHTDSATMQPKVGMRLESVKGRVYELNRLLGAGTFASVWKAKNLATNALHAVKIFELGEALCTTEDVEEACEWESAVLTDILKLSCPYLTQMDEVFKDVDSGLHCIVMRLVEGSPLHKRMLSPYTLGDVLRWTRQLVTALNCLASLEPEPLVHGDVRPDNILVEASTGSLVLGGCEFAMWQGRKTGLRLPNWIRTSSAYVAPERRLLAVLGPTSGLSENAMATIHKELLKEVGGGKLDMWSLGVVVYLLGMRKSPLGYVGDDPRKMDEVDAVAKRADAKRWLETELRVVWSEGKDGELELLAKVIAGTLQGLDRRLSAKEVLEILGPVDYGIDPSVLLHLHQALKEGTEAFRVCRLMLMGPGRVGKTSLRKALLHQDFDPNEASTAVYEVDVIDTENWKAQQTVGLDSRRLAAARATRVMQRSRKRGREGNNAEEREKTKGQAEDNDKDRGDREAIRGPGAGVGGAAMSTPELPAPPLTELAAVARGSPSGGGAPAVTGDTFEPQDYELVRRYMIEGVPVDLTVRCFDFAGQEVYYCLHSLFLRSEAVFVVAFNLQEALAATKSAESERTSFLSSISFWINSIQTHARLPAAAADIVLVGTHTDQLGAQLPSKLQIIESMLVQELCCTEAYRRIVQRASTEGPRLFFPVCNDTRQARDPELENVQRAVDTVISGLRIVREPKPIAWVHLLERLRKGDHIVTVREVQLEGEGRKDEELRAALRYFHELGEVIYFDDLMPEDQWGDNIVILDPQWLARMFRSIITRRGQTEVIRSSLSAAEALAPQPFTQYKWAKLWSSFLDQGILQRELLEKYLWADVKPVVRQNTLLMLDRLNLLCPILPASDIERPPQAFLVPCVPLFDFGDGTSSLVAADSSICLASFDFQGFLPDTLFPRVLLSGVRQGHWGPPKMGLKRAIVTPYSLGAARVVLALESREHRISVYQHDPITTPSALQQACTLLHEIFTCARDCLQATACGGSLSLIIKDEDVDEPVTPPAIEGALRGHAHLTHLAPTTTRESKALEEADFLVLDDLRVKSKCACALELVSCPALAAGGDGLFVRKFIEASEYDTYEREVNVSLAIPPDKKHLFCAVVAHGRSIKYGNTFYLVTPHCAYGDLDTLLRKPKSQQPAWFADYGHIARCAASLVKGISVMHRQLSRLHLDLKAANIFMAGARVRIGDMGISQIIGPSEGDRAPLQWDTREAFMAPEQALPAAASFVCKATDRWQLGVLLLQLLCRTPLDLLPLGGKLLHELSKQEIEALLTPHCASSPLRGFVLSLLEHSVDHRLTDEGMEQALANVAKAEGWSLKD